MHPAVWWIITAVVFFILELTTASFFFLWIGAGAVITAGVSFFYAVDWVQYSTFAISSVILVTISRRWASRFSGSTKREANVDSLIGQSAIVTQVDKHNHSKGYIKVAGEDWKAETKTGEVLRLNMSVSVVEARGNILVVKA
jgi:membrane protein implicated in regulation of membrane protease activity